MGGEELPQSLLAKSGQWWPPSVTVTSTTPRLSVQPAVEVVTGPLVSAVGF